MKKIICIGCLWIGSISMLYGQQDSTASSWEFNASANFYFFPDDFISLPVLQADKNKLHLEARYNYEDLETFSGWIGYNFSGGDDVFSYTFTPMLGGVVGSTDGIAPGLEFTITYKNFELYSEMENVFDLSDKENNFYYNWTDLTYSPTDWLWFGISGQRTRLYQTEVEIQRGLIVGAGLKQWELTSYLYNFDVDNPFFLVSLSIGF